MENFVSVPISLELFKEIINRTNKPSQLIENVVYDYLDRTDEDFKHEKTGVYWDKLFLPNGTKIRTKYYNEIIEASIVENDIIWNKKKYTSISRLINEMRGNTSNNAWIMSEIKRPNDKFWIVADKLRENWR